MGQSPSSADYNSNQHGLPFLQGNAEFGDESPNPSIWCATSSKRAQKNDILGSVLAPIGSINIANQPYGIGRGLCAVRSKSVSYRYLYYQLLIRKPELESIGTGSIFRAVTVDQIKNIKLWIPPKNEQEEILSYLSSALNTIKQKILAHESQIELLLEYRIALINEAVTGKIDVREEIGFLRESQPEEWEKLRGFHGSDIESKLLDRMEQNREIFERVFGDREFGESVKDWMLQKVFDAFNKSGK